MDALYGTHIPILKALAKAIEIRSVIEFGAGRFSTPLFLDRAAFPLLERLVSIETDKTWAAEAFSAGDPRHVVHLCASEPDAVQSYIGRRFDLALVDGPLDSRPEIIAAAWTLAPITAVHDAEERPINKAVMDSFRFVYLFAPWRDPGEKEHPEPWTALCADDEAASRLLASIRPDAVLQGAYA